MFLLVFGCSSSEKIPKQKEKDQLAFTFERTACFGTCPEYKISVYMTGRAILEGKDNIEFIGSFECQDCDQEMLAKVIETSDRINFWDMEDKYDPGVTDLPSTITTFYQRKEPKQVINVMDGPEELKELESLIFDLYLKRTWTKISK